jgi:phosphotransacetylase
MESLNNVLFDEIRIGDKASVSRRLSVTEVEALALVGGDVDAFHIADGEPRGSVGLQAESVGAEALLSGLLNRRLPGPGTSIVAQDLHFDGSLRPGDELVATVTAKAKRAKAREVVFDCKVRAGRVDLITGIVTVRAPEKRLHYTDLATPSVILRRADKYARLLKACEKLPPVPCAVVYPCDKESLLGPVEAAKRGLITPILVGPEQEIRAVAKAAGVDILSYRTVNAEHGREAAAKAVALARDGEVLALMKGSLHTDELLGAVVSSATGLRTARRISHVFVMDVPTYPRALFLTDIAITILPTLEDKVDILKNAIDLARVLGLAEPKVAILSAVETVSPKIPSTLEAAALCKMADRGQITGAVIDGPLAFDNAISEEAARTKKIKSPVAGKADILLVPDLEAGNMLAKQLQYLAGADAAGIVLGARVPIVLTSRADTVRTRLASAALVKLVAHARQQSGKAGASKP